MDSHTANWLNELSILALNPNVNLMGCQPKTAGLPKWLRILFNDKGPLDCLCSIECVPALHPHADCVV